MIFLVSFMMPRDNKEARHDLDRVFASQCDYLRVVRIASTYLAASVIIICRLCMAVVFA